MIPLPASCSNAVRSCLGVRPVSNTQRALDNVTHLCPSRSKPFLPPHPSRTGCGRAGCQQGPTRPALRRPRSWARWTLRMLYSRRSLVFCAVPEYKSGALSQAFNGFEPAGVAAPAGSFFVMTIPTQTQRLRSKPRTLLRDRRRERCEASCACPRPARHASPIQAIEPLVGRRLGASAWTARRRR